ncbi:hypothetical protein CQ14_03025 [Bradyrhizobium lablabi]|uniref:Uncharacterized protein n=1 Tax=Bradyrhizobium lablabi TaxID=722472 RepID=A0A0R3N3D2_9BRAD|nr:hypothetical protein [Bradyrhizobium lablabi]KRR26474.1 hypothetical protein CQ14_03025 [Bradyrhizobium lablabi]
MTEHEHDLSASYRECQYCRNDFSRISEHFSLSAKAGIPVPANYADGMSVLEFLNAERNAAPTQRLRNDAAKQKIDQSWAEVIADLNRQNQSR